MKMEEMQGEWNNIQEEKKQNEPIQTKTKIFLECL